MRIHALFSLLILCLPLGIFAQNQEETNQKKHTYEEAVELLTEGEEFTEKGILPPLPTIGKQIHSARMKHNVSLSTLSYVSGLEEGTMIKIEEDRITPSRKIIAAIEDFLGEEIIIIDLK